MALWTDVIDPATLSGYARASLADYEARKGTLARWLPNRVVPSIDVKFVKGQSGLVEVAEFRAYDAEPTVGSAQPAKTVTLELPALGRNFPISEYNQLRANGANPGDDAVLVTIRNTTDTAVRSIADAIEKLRGTVLETGKATVSGFMDDDFGRSGNNTDSAGVKWDASSGTIDVLGDLTEWIDSYIDTNGEAPGAIIASMKVVRAIAKTDQFATQLVNSASRPATLAQVNEVLVGSEFPPIYPYDRRVRSGGSNAKVLNEKKIILAPAPVEDVNDYQGTALGGTFWGRTLTSQASDWDIPEADQPGLVTGVYRNEKPPMIAEVIGDAIGMPVLANADLTFVATVLT